MKWIALLILLAGCPPTPAPDPKPTPDPGPEPPPPIANCETACAHASALGCSWSKPTAKGASCIDVCQNAQTWQPWDLACRSSAASCAAADECDQ
jgi:hypothetical protein